MANPSQQLLISLGSSETPFISSWKTDNAGSANTHIIIPTSATGTYNCVVDWGDGNTSTITTYNDAAWDHTYSVAGTYTVKIYGVFNGIFFNNVGDKAKILNISQWGSQFRLGVAQGSYFRGCLNLTITATDILSIANTTSMFFAFTSCASLTTIPSINSWDWSKITTTRALFNLCTSYNQNISLNTSSLWITATAMYLGCTTYNGTQTFASVSGLTDMVNMYSGNSAFNQSLATLNSAPAVDRSNMLFNCSAWNQDISGFNIAAMTAASSMMSGSAFSITNYNKLLDSVTGWPSQATIQDGVTFHAGTAHYSGANAIAGHATLAVTHIWNITDGGTP